MNELEAQRCAHDLRARYYANRASTIMSIKKPFGWVIEITDPLLTQPISTHTAREAEFVMACLELLDAITERNDGA